MSDTFADVQRIVLMGSSWEVSQQLVLGFQAGSAPLHFLNQLITRWCPTRVCDSKPGVQVSLGFSRRGLERVPVPSYALACFAAKAPAFTAGAALRSASRLGHCGDDAPENWDPAFCFMKLDAVLSLHASAHKPLRAAFEKIQEIAADTNVELTALPLAQRLPAPEGEQWVHFGYRDGLARVEIEGWPNPRRTERSKPQAIHAAGEFLLGHRQNSGANPWMASAGHRVWSEELRAFFRNGSFGVLQHVEQHVAEFETFVAAAARANRLGVEDIKAKLCGRTPQGWPLAKVLCADPDADFDYTNDPKGRACPFGAHVRRMNPRGGDLAHSRPRPLLRRGMPYGPTWQHPPENKSRGLMGQFFCASIEDQFEHLLGQWADRVPMGSLDGGGARDPLVGAHEPGDGSFEIPMASGAPLILTGLRRFTRTRGTAYLFYPSVKALRRIANNELFADLREDDE